MNLKSIFATCCVFGLVAVAPAQELEFTQYLGEIPAADTPVVLAGDAEGNLFYGTFTANTSVLRVLQNPETHIGAATVPGDVLRVFTEMGSGRGVQGLDVAENGDLYVGGDSSNAAIGNLWKFERTSISPLTFSESFPFVDEVTADSPKRRHGVAIISDAGAGLLAASHFTGVDFFDFSGNLLSSVGGGSNYIRELVYNSQDNILYPLRNGTGSNNMIDYFYTNINTTDGSGATFVPYPGFIDDGAANGAFGDPTQNGYYYESQHQLITVDGPQVQAGITPKIRVWDIIDDNGSTSVTLAYSIDSINEGEPITGVTDAEIIGNRMYVTNENRDTIMVFGPVNASVGRWDEYELY